MSPCVPENLVSRDGFSHAVPRQPAHLHTQAESGAYLRGSSRVPRRRPFMKPPYATGSVPRLSGHAIAYRWRSLPRVRRHRASKPQGSSERLLPWQITMDQLICASLSHIHYWCEVGMLKVPADERVTDCVLLVYVIQDSVFKNNYVDNKVGRATEILWHRAFVAGSIPDGDKKVFFHNLAIMYWTLNCIYVQFEYQCPK